jgi:hypothetical protein
MDNHKLATIFILYFLKHHKNAFLFFKKYAWKTFRIWPYAWKQNIYFFMFLKWGIVLIFLDFFWNFREKLSIFNIGSISYNVSLHFNIKWNYWKKNVVVFYDIRELFFEFLRFFWNFRENQVFLIRGLYFTMYVYSLILGNNYWKNMWGTHK